MCKGGIIVKKIINNKKEKLISMVIISFILLSMIFLSLGNTVESSDTEEDGSYYISQGSEVEGMCKYLSDIEYDTANSKVEWGSITIDANLETQYNNGLITLLLEGKKTYFLKGISAHATSTLIYNIKRR